MMNEEAGGGGGGQYKNPQSGAQISSLRLQGLV
jgi:hypothetical protein